MFKNVLITGGAGFIGSHLVDLLLSKGKNIFVLDSLTYAGNINNLNLSQVNFYHGNINNAELVKHIFEKNNIDTVINCAAETHVDNSIHSPSIFVETNVAGTLNLLRCALDYYKKSCPNLLFLQVSTDEVYGALGEEGFFTENSPISPRSPYSASKAAADHLVSAFHETYGLPAIITRCSNNFGTRQNKEKFIPTIINCLIDKKSIPVYGKGVNVRDWISVTDHCQGIIAALEKRNPGEVYCFGGNCEISNIDLVHIVINKWQEMYGENLEHLISFVQDRLGHDFRYAIDFSYAKQTLGFTPKLNIREVMGNIIVDIKNNKTDIVEVA